MKLIDILNKANSGRKIPMFVWDVYIGSKNVSYVKKAFFFKDSFDYFTYNAIKNSEEFHKKELQKQLVEIDHLEEDSMGREVKFFLKLDEKVIEHYEPANAYFSYGGMLLNDKMEIIGGMSLNIATMKFNPFYF